MAFLHPHLAPYAERYQDDGSFVSLTIRAHLPRPFERDGPLNLDLILAAAVVDEALGVWWLDDPSSTTVPLLPTPLRCLWRDEDAVPLWAATPLVPVPLEGHGRRRHPPSWEARVIGDPEEITRLLGRVTVVGRRRDDAREVERWEVLPGPPFQLVRDGHLTRSLPVAARGLLEGRVPTEPPTLIGWTPPQWKPTLVRPGWWRGTPV